MFLKNNKIGNGLTKKYKYLSLNKIFKRSRMRDPQNNVTTAQFEDDAEPGGAEAESRQTRRAAPVRSLEGDGQVGEILVPLSGQFNF